MVLADWTVDSGLGTTITSENDSPTSNPTLKCRFGSTTGTIKGIPTGNTINNIDISGIDNGKIEALIKQNWVTNNGSRVSNILYFRYIDANNHYRVRFQTFFGGTTNDAVILEYVSGGAVSTIATINTQAIAGATNTWYKVRVSWWSALGKIWLRVEYATTPFTSFTQIGSDTSFSTDGHKGASNKVGFGFELASWGSFGEIDELWIEDFAVYSA